MRSVTLLRPGHDLRDGKNDGSWRTIVTNPANTELATEFFGLAKSELPDPTGQRTLESVKADEAVAGDSPNQLWVREVATDARRKVYSYRGLDTGVVWSTDGRWVAVTDYDYTATSSVARCMLLDAEGTVSEDLSKVIARYDAATGRHMPGNKDVQCRVFGWIRGTSRVALTVTGRGRADPLGFRQDFFYDVVAHTLIAVR
jgi:hypothetical protein